MQYQYAIISGGHIAKILLSNKLRGRGSYDLNYDTSTHFESSCRQNM